MVQIVDQGSTELVMRGMVGYQKLRIGTRPVLHLSSRPRTLVPKQGRSFRVSS